MSLNDEKERLDLAERYLLEYGPSTQEFEAALEHVRWVYEHKPELQGRAEAVMKNVVARRHEEQHTMAKLGSFKS